MLLALHCTAMQSLPLELGIQVSIPSNCDRLLKIAFGHKGVKAELQNLGHLPEEGYVNVKGPCVNRPEDRNHTTHFSQGFSLFRMIKEKENEDA